MPAVQRAIATPTPHYAVYVVATGELVSIGDAPLVNPLPKTLAHRVLLNVPNMAAEQWDAARKRMTDQPARVTLDRIDDMMADASVTALTGPQQAAIHTALLAIFGTVDGRYYGG